MTTLANTAYLSGAPACDSPGNIARVASFSPDQRKFVVVLRRGDTGRDVNRYTMLLWNTAGLDSERPRQVLQWESSSDLPAIDPASISWAHDGQSLTFLGERPSEHHKLFELNVTTGAVRALTEHPTNVMSYSRSANGAVTAYEALPPAQSLWDARTARNGLTVTTETASDIILGEKRLFPVPMTERQLFVKDVRGSRVISPLPGNVFLGDSLGMDNYDIATSPDGRYLVALESVSRRGIPGRWHEYNNWLVRYFFRLEEIWNATPVSLFKRYVLVDLRTGKSRILLNSPVLLPRAVIWAPDSRSVVLSQVLLPVEENSSGEDVRRASAPASVAVDILTDAVARIGKRCFAAVNWTNDGLICEAPPDYVATAVKGYATSAPSRNSSYTKMSNCPAPEAFRFGKKSGVWVEMGQPASPQVSLSLEEGLNTPPKIYFTVRGEQVERLLMDLNPQFQKLKLSRVKQITWEWSKGQKMRGGLYYPPDYHPGRRYPLVIQTHDFNSERFEFFGPYSTAFAAMPLAARDMFVLQMNDIKYSQEFRGRWQLVEVKNAMEIYKTAIGHLSQQGLIDPKRVGIIGFSHTCFYVRWALAHDPDLFAAASVTEGADGGYVAFMLDLPNSVDVHSLYGSDPFGIGLKTWTQLSPSFNLEHVRAPLLVTVLHHGSVLSDWEWFEGLKYLEKPVQMVVLDGRARDDHLLQEPWDREISSGGNVDWFDFWLNGHEDPSPKKAEEYARWRGLRLLYEHEVEGESIRRASD